MQVRTIKLVAALVSVSLLAALAGTATAGDGQKGKKKEAGAKVEIKDLPAAVTDAAKKELPNANWTSAEKLATKKQGSVYSLQGKDGKFQVTMMMSTSGDLLRLIKTAGKGKKVKAG